MSGFMESKEYQAWVAMTKLVNIDVARELYDEQEDNDFEVVEELLNYRLDFLTDENWEHADLDDFEEQMASVMCVLRAEISHRERMVDSLKDAWWGVEDCGTIIMVSTPQCKDVAQAHADKYGGTVVPVSITPYLK